MLTSSGDAAPDRGGPACATGNLACARPAPGFTLVELMVSVAVLGILVVMSVPSLRGVIENGRIRTAGESMRYGLSLARAEAVRLNTPVEFVNEAGGWQVLRVIDGSRLHGSSGKESARDLELTTTPAGATRVTYDSFGRVFSVNPTDDSEPIAEIGIESLRPPTTSDYRPLRLQVQRGGSARLCDPAVDTSDPRVCL
jgi:type IV fimbrial biogenesis protein FimT